MFFPLLTFQIIHHIMTMAYHGGPVNTTEGIVPISLNKDWLHGCLVCTVAGEVHFLFPAREAWSADAGCALPDDVPKIVKTGIVYRMDFRQQDCYQAKPFKLMFSDDVWRYDPARRWVQEGRPEPARPLIHSGPYKEALCAAINDILRGDAPPL